MNEERYRLPLAVGILLVLLVGGALALLQPGDLGDEDEVDTALGTTTTSTSRPLTDDGTTTVPGETATPGGVPGETTAPGETTVPDGQAGPATTAPPGAPGGGGQPGGGSGLGADGAGTVDDGLAETGPPSLLLPAGMLLLGAAGGLRRLARG